MMIDTFAGQHSSDVSEAVQYFQTAVRKLAEHRPGLVETLYSALSADPNLIAAHALLGFAKISLARPEFDEEIKVYLETAIGVAKIKKITPSECALLDALALASNGKLLAAASRLDAYLLHEPRDFLVLKLSHGLRFMSGDLSGMLNTTANVLSAYDDDVVGSGFVLGCHAFGLEEAGSFDEAERCGRMAVEREPFDAWGLHAVAHVFEMQNRSEEGILWLEKSRLQWSGCNNFSGHVSWHLALFHIEQGDYEQALSIYDNHIRHARTEDYRDIANATTLLWRLQQFGANVGNRWDELLEIAQRRVSETKLLFATMHHLLTLIACHKIKDAEQMLSHLICCAQSQNSDQSYVAKQVAIDLANSLIGKSDSFEDIDRLQIAKSLVYLGGSHAQRDVFIQILALQAADIGNKKVFSEIMMLRHQTKTHDRFTSVAYALDDMI